MYRFPPQYVSIAVANVVGTATGIVVPAGGVGTRIRVVGGQLGINRLSGAAICDVSLQSAGITLATARGLQLTGTPFMPLVIPEPGVQVADNTDLILSVTASAASGSSVATVYYFIDQST